MNHRPILVSMVLSALWLFMAVGQVLAAQYARTQIKLQAPAANSQSVQALSQTKNRDRLMFHPPTPTTTLSYAQSNDNEATVAGISHEIRILQKSKATKDSLKISIVKPSLKTKSEGKIEISPTPITKQLNSDNTPTNTPSAIKTTTESSQENFEKTLMNESDKLEDAKPTNSPEPTIKPTPQPVNLNESMNNYREKNGKNRLETREDICELSRTRAEEIRKDFSHQGFENRVKDGTLSQLGYKSIAENIWYSTGSFTSQTIIDAWDGSPGHKDNMQEVWTWGCGSVVNGHAAFIFMR